MNTHQNLASFWINALQEFRAWLAEQQLSGKTIRNYLSDLHLWATWLKQRDLFWRENPGKLSDLLALYLSHLQEVGTSPATFNRKLASARRFAEFLTQKPEFQIQLHVPNNPLPAHHVESAKKTLVDRFALALAQQGRKQDEIENLATDVGLFLSSFENHSLTETLTKSKLANYLRKLREQGAASLDLKQTRKNLEQFAAWAADQGYLAGNPFSWWSRLVTKFGLSSLPLAEQARRRFHYSAREKAKSPFGKIYHFYHQLPFTSYLHLAILVIFAASLGVFGYQQFYSQVSQPFAYPSSPVTPNRYLNFQGRLTDSSGVPITTSIATTFELFANSAGGTALWSGSCNVDPDNDGIFTILLGSDCGSEITEDVFSEDASIWLEITVGGETLTPRQRIATVPYALNSETVQGYPVTETGAVNSVVAVNSSGQLVLGVNNASLIATTGTFTVQGEVLVLQTEAGGDITVQPGSDGSVFITPSSNTEDGVEISNASQVTGDLISGTVANNNTGFNLINLLSGAVPTSRFSVAADGGVTISGLTADRFVRTTTGGLLTTSQFVDLTTQVTGTLPIANGGTNSTATPTQGGIAYGTGSAYAFTSAGSSGQCLQSNGTSAPTWGTCTSSLVEYWTLTSGALHTTNNTADVLIGGTATNSAKFAFLNVNTGTPTASVSAGAAGASYLTATGNLATTAMQNLSLGGSSTGDITLSPRNNAGRVGINTTSFAPNAALTLTGGHFYFLNSGATRNIGFDQTAGAGTTLQVLGALGTSAGGDVNVTGGASGATGDGGLLVLRGGASNSDNGGDVVISGGTGGGTNGDVLPATITGNVGVGDSTPLALFTVGTSDAFQINASGTVTTTSTITGTTLNGTTGINTGVGAGTQRIDSTGNLVNIADITASGTITFSGLTPNRFVRTTTGGELITAEFVDLTTQVTGTLPIANGGTNSTATPTLGGIAYGTGTAYAFTAAGNLNECLVSNGAGAPTWGSCSTGVTQYWEIDTGALRTTNNTLDLLVGGDATTSAKFAVLNVDSGTPTASVSAGTAGAAYLTSTGLLTTTARQDMTIGSVTAGDIYLDSDRDLFFSDTRTGNIPFTIADTALNAALTQGIIDAINDVYDFANGGGTFSGFWQLNNTHVLSPRNDSFDLSVGGTATASADITLTSQGGAIFNQNSNDVDFRIKSDVGANDFFFDGATGWLGLGDAVPAGRLEIATTDGDDPSLIVHAANVTTQPGMSIRSLPLSSEWATARPLTSRSLAKVLPGQSSTPTAPTASVLAPLLATPSSAAAPPAP